ncbi:MAG TPA: alpha/beta hydrolase [Pseudomonadales bacterium]
MTAFDNPRFIDTNGIRMAVYEQGAGKPIVLCHGFPELAYSWRHQMQPLADAGYHVLAPDQRGYGRTDKPKAVEDYDIVALTGDLVGLLDHYGYPDAVFVGHDWGAIVVWAMAVLHPDRVAGVINLSVPFMDRGTTEWVGFWEKMLGGDFYIVHFNRQFGVADAAFARDPKNLLRNLYRTEGWKSPPRVPKPGMAMINLVDEQDPPGKLMMSEAELDVFAKAFAAGGFTGPINWYRNFTRNWTILGNVPQKVTCPALMIHGNHDIVPESPKLKEFVPRAEVATLECGHWIQQEQPAQTNALILGWLQRNFPA